MLSMKPITMRVWQGNDKKERHDKPVTLVPPIKVILRILREPVEGRRGKSIASDPGSVSFPESGLGQGHSGLWTSYGLRHQWKDKSRSRRECFEKHAKKADYSCQTTLSEG